jgi:membrane protein implicated in regulation of membrane protease activity
MPSLYWLLIGILLLAVELFTPGGFFLLFFGLGALLVGALSAILPDGLFALPLQVILFLIVSFAGLFFFRGALVTRFSRRALGHSEVDNLSDTVGIALEDLSPGGIGKVELRGSAWSARNTGSVPLVRGQRCAVERVDGLTLWVRLAPDEFLAPLSRKEQTT